MDKIKINKKQTLDNYSGYVGIESDSDIYIIGDCKIYEIICNNQYKVNIYLSKDSSLEFNRFVLGPEDEGSINIFHEENSSINFNESIIAKERYKLDIYDNVDYSNIISNIRIRLIADKESTILINANGKVKKDTINNIVNEDIKCFNLDESKIEILPNLIVDSNDVIANHNAVIKNVNPDELLYLNMKGISNEEAISLLRDGFVLSLFEDDFKKEIKDYL